MGVWHSIPLTRGDYTYYITYNYRALADAICQTNYGQNYDGIKQSIALTFETFLTLTYEPADTTRLIDHSLHFVHFLSPWTTPNISTTSLWYYKGGGSGGGPVSYVFGSPNSYEIRFNPSGLGGASTSRYSIRWCIRDCVISQP